MTSMFGLIQSNICLTECHSKLPTIIMDCLKQVSSLQHTQLTLGSLFARATLFTCGTIHPRANSLACLYVGRCSLRARMLEVAHWHASAFMAFSLALWKPWHLAINLSNSQNIILLLKSSFNNCLGKFYEITQVGSSWSLKLNQGDNGF